MRRGLTALRHGVTVAVGTFTMWLIYEWAFAALSLVPGYKAKVIEWATAQPQVGAATALALFLTLAIVLSWIQEVPRTRGLRFSVWVGMAFGAVTFELA